MARHFQISPYLYYYRIINQFCKGVNSKKATIVKFNQI